MSLNNIFQKRTPDILECIANLSSDEVFTPPQVANQILDLLPKEVWANPNIKILDPCCKTGIFLRECAKRFMVGLEQEIPSEKVRREHIYKNMLYGIGITGITSQMSRRSLYYSKTATSKHSVIKFGNAYGNIIYENIEHTFKNDRCVYCGVSMRYNRGKDLENHAYQFLHQDLNELFKNMKFDVIIGNPPYQLKDKGFGASAMPIYQKFIEKAIEYNPSYISMIIPSRWFAGGKGLDTFRENMLSDRRLKVLVDYPNAEECFPGVEVKGGVCYFLWDARHSGECEVVSMLNGEEMSRVRRKLDEYDVFIRFNESIDILNKVRAKKEATLERKVSSRKPFGLATNFENFKLKKFKDSLKLFANKKIGWVERNKIRANEQWIKKYKVLLTRAYGAGSGYPHQITNKPIVAGPKTVCTETYLVIDVFNDKEKAENMAEYIKTRFFRFLVSLKKNTQDNPRETFSFVPDLDMSQKWTDKKLYKRYGITEEEQKFIESIVREMS